MNQLALLFLCAAIFFSCNEQSTKDVALKGSSKIEYAKHFQLVQHSDFVELRIFSPKDHVLEKRFALVHRGKKVNTDLSVIETPVEHLGAFSSSFIPMIEELGAISAIGATTNSDYIYNPTVKQRIAKGLILESKTETELSADQLIEKDIRVVVFSGFGSPYPNEDKLQRLSVYCIPNYDWEETHVFGKAEWIKLFGALLEKNEEASLFFDEMVSNYKHLKQEIQPKQQRKVILGGMANGAWYAPAGESFLAKILKDAQLDYIYKNVPGTASVSKTLEQILSDGEQCDLWINAEGQTYSSLLLSEPKLKDFHCLKHQNGYTYFNNTNYFWEYNSMHPDWLLEDFGVISGALTPRKMHFYSKVRP